MSIREILESELTVTEFKQLESYFDKYKLVSALAFNDTIPGLAYALYWLGICEGMHVRDGNLNSVFSKTQALLIRRVFELHRDL